jgi:hypothetical protein
VQDVVVLGDRQDDLVWQCSHRYGQTAKCKTPHHYDQLLWHAFNAEKLHLLESRTKFITEYRDFLLLSNKKSS